MPEATKLVQKRCAKCGWVGAARPNVRKCRQRRFGKGSWACWGDLALAVSYDQTRPAAEAPKLDARGAARQRLQKTERALKQRRRLVDEAQAEVVRWAKLVGRRQRDVRKLEALAERQREVAGMTDEQLAAAKAKRVEAAQRARDRKSRRGIDLRGVWAAS